MTQIFKRQPVMLSLLDEFKENSIDKIFSDMDKAFRTTFPSLFEQYGLDGRIIGSGYPRTDVYIKDKKLIFKSEINGYKKEDINIKLNKQNGYLEISGKNSHTIKEKDCKYLLNEVKSSSFKRVFPLDFDLLNFDESDAKFKNGFLEISIPYLKNKSKENIEKFIEIN